MEGTDPETAAVVQRRFPGHEEAIDRAYLESPAFRALCHDYVMCLTALDHWRDHGGPGPPSRAAEYAELLDELTKEIAGHVGKFERKS